MKKILFISFLNLTTGNSEGVSKKIKSQILALQKNNINVAYTFTRNRKMYINIEKKEIYLFDLLPQAYKNNMKLFSFLNKIYKENIENIKEYDLYIRNQGKSVQELLFYKNTQSKKIIEIPTYPYSGELENRLKSKIGYIQSEILNMFLKKYISNIITFSDHKEIWGIPCINISNGIDLESAKLIAKIEDDTTTFTSVSICSPWHGIDRFLKSLDIYLKENPTSKIKFNIVGEGVETEKLKQIVNDSEYLNGVVVFHGFQSGGKLDAIYNETDIAVGSLGRHRSGLTSLKTLKNREYAAKGLPIIYSEIDTDFEEQSFVHKVTPDEEVIDLTQVITWYQELKIQPEEIREYAKQFSWNTQMKKVIDAIEEN